jgi:hypothetical protein
VVRVKYQMITLFVAIVIFLSFPADASNQLLKPNVNQISSKVTVSEQVTPSISSHPPVQMPNVPQTGRNYEVETIGWLFWRWLAPVLLGGVGATAINIYWAQRSRKREIRGFILILCAEFVTAFSRCVTNYDQFNKGEISYSSLFVLSDASVLSKFASLIGRGDLVMATMNLKSYFFQIERHIETTSKYIMEAGTTKDIFQKGPFLDRAAKEQGAAVAFFISPYKNIVQDIELLINESLKITKGSIAQDLDKKFKAAVNRKNAIDSKREAEARELVKQSGFGKTQGEG